MMMQSEARDRQRHVVAESNRALAAVAGAVIGGVALGVAAVVARKGAVREYAAPAVDWDTALVAHYAATLELCDALEATGANSVRERPILLTRLQQTLARHAMDEECVTDLACCANGTIGTDALKHQYAGQYLYELVNLPPDSVEFPVTLASFRTDIEARLREDEDVLFPRLKARIEAPRNAHPARRGTVHRVSPA